MTKNISVIIPVYNAENTIVKCLDSLANQSISQKYYEVICVDDGSFDNSFATLTAYNDIKNFITFTQPNSGPARARNNGVEKARGNILLFTDSDCILDYYWIHEMTKPFDESDVFGVQGRYKTKQKQIISQFEQIEIENSYRKMEIIGNIDSIGTYSAAYNKKIFSKFNGYNEKYKKASGEDFELSYRISNSGYRLVFNKNAICYHKHPEKLIEYLKIKLKRGIWRALIYKNVQNKILSDSYTSNVLKLQFVSVLLLILSLPILFININYYIYPAFCLVVFLFLCIPFVLFSYKYNKAIALISPFIIFLRSLFFIMGISIGVFKLMIKR